MQAVKGMLLDVLSFLTASKHVGGTFCERVLRYISVRGVVFFLCVPLRVLQCSTTIFRFPKGRY